MNRVTVLTNVVVTVGVDELASNFQQFPQTNRVQTKHNDIESGSGGASDVANFMFPDLN